MKLLKHRTGAVSKASTEKYVVFLAQSAYAQGHEIKFSIEVLRQVKNVKLQAV
jgi:hypothetical protein